VAATLPGILLSASSDISAAKTRSSLQEGYAQVIADLLRADTLLPETVTAATTPSRTASKALLARVYLSMRDYAHAFVYADRALARNNFLMDYNSLSAAATYPIPKINGEDIFHSRMNTYLIMTYAVTDSVLYRSYATNDLRRTVFFNTSTGSPVFKGSYEGASSFYSGLATDEMYLIRAECHARAGRIASAMADLNALLVKRWKTNSYINLTAGTSKDALDLVLQERQKELLFRGLRWADLKRLNKEQDRAITLTRVIGGQTYTLPPNDLRYVFLLPEAEVAISNVQQNPR
jgi:tetratricopeptide (TPR) repeat protein